MQYFVKHDFNDNDETYKSAVPRFNIRGQIWYSYQSNLRSLSHWYWINLGELM